MPTKPKFGKFYFPGMISLVCLPLLCVEYFLCTNSFQKIGVIDVIWENTQGFKEMSKFLHIDIDVDSYRKYHDISFIGNPAHDAAEQAKLKTMLVCLNQNTDFVNGIRVTFGRHCRYVDVVAAIDNFNQNADKVNGLAIINNQMFIFQPSPNKSKAMIPLDCLLMI